jgi:hypothetical protein
MRKPVAMLAFVVLVASLAAAFPAATFAASPTSTSAPASTPTVETNQGALPHWVVKASKFVDVSNGIATIDPAASRALDSTTYGLTVEAVAHYNALPASEKLAPLPVTGVVVTGGQGNTVQPMMINIYACASGSYIQFNWWGTHFKMSECLTQYLTKTVTAAGAVIAVIGAVFSWAPTVIFVPIGLIIAAAGPVIDWVDATFCDNHGAAINLPVLGPDNIGC